MADRCDACLAGNHQRCDQVLGNAGGVDALDFIDFGCDCPCEESQCPACEGKGWVGVAVAWCHGCAGTGWVWKLPTTGGVS